MIKWSYGRIKNKFNYDGNLLITNVSSDGKDITEDDIESEDYNDVPLEEMVAALHNFLGKYPEAEITVMVKGREKRYGSPETKYHALDSKFRDLIRDNLSEALKLFAPIERKVFIKIPKNKQEKQHEW